MNVFLSRQTVSHRNKRRINVDSWDSTRYLSHRRTQHFLEHTFRKHVHALTTGRRDEQHYALYKKPLVLWCFCFLFYCLSHAWKEQNTCSSPSLMSEDMQRSRRLWIHGPALKQLSSEFNCRQSSRGVLACILFWMSVLSTCWVCGAASWLQGWIITVPSE